MRWLAVCLLGLVVLLQAKLWFGDSSRRDLWRLRAEIETQTTDNQRLMEEHRVLAAEVEALKTSPAAIEARARRDLGMIKRGETFFMVTEPRGRP